MSCERKIGPYDCCSVICGDCFELMQQIPDAAIDAIITDPPYGINYRYTGPPNTIKYQPIYGDDKLFDPSQLLSKCDHLILWGANNFANLLPVGGWLVWDKRCSLEADRILGSQFELAWCSHRQLFKMIRLLHGGAKNADALNGDSSNECRYHPTQKPVRLMEWCIRQAPYWNLALTILDPFCGSGSTLIAAKKLGRHFLGFEISPEYCEIASRRLADIDAQPTLFETKPQQPEQLILA